MGMTQQWDNCVNKAGTDAICPLIRDVTALLVANYDN
jgi:hypothetical protein